MFIKFWSVVTHERLDLHKLPLAARHSPAPIAEKWQFDTYVLYIHSRNIYLLAITYVLYCFRYSDITNKKNILNTLLGTD